MDPNENLRRLARRSEKSKYERLITAGRDNFSEEQMELLFTLHEKDTKDEAAEELGITLKELEDKLSEMVAWREGTERKTKEDKPFKKRLGKAALVKIFSEYPDLTDEERLIVQAQIDSPNQTVAGISLGITYSEFEKRYNAIRQKHGF